MAAQPIAEKAPLKIVREPSVYLIGRQTLDRASIDRFLGDHGVTWQTDTEVGGEALAEMAGRVCYMSYGKGRKTNREFLGHIVDVGHGSVLEHAVWSFVVTGVSRSFTHELIRHRHFSYSQLSQRYVDESESAFIEPDVIAADPELHQTWVRGGERRACGLRPAGRRARAALHRRFRSKHAAPQDGAPGGALGAAQRHRDQDLRHRQRARAAALHRAARLASTPTSRSARSRSRCSRSCGRESPNLFADYTLEPLADGTHATHTEHPKV